jgi:hypothetical protein
VFADECSTNIALTKLYARAPRGERALGQAARNWGKTVPSGPGPLQRSPHSSEGASYSSSRMRTSGGSSLPGARANRGQRKGRTRIPWPSIPHTTLAPAYGKPTIAFSGRSVLPVSLPGPPSRESSFFTASLDSRLSVLPSSYMWSAPAPAPTGLARLDRLKAEKFSRSWDAIGRSKSHRLGLIVVRARRYWGRRWTRRTDRLARNRSVLFVGCSQLYLLSLAFAILHPVAGRSGGFLRWLGCVRRQQSLELLVLVGCLGAGFTRLLPVSRGGLPRITIPRRSRIEQEERPRLLRVPTLCWTSRPLASPGGGQQPLLLAAPPGRIAGVGFGVGDFRLAPTAWVDRLDILVMSVAPCVDDLLAVGRVGRVEAVRIVVG